ncbi:hypothetical protein CVT24_000027 [Panaeolus cyanescens]|uniref:Glycosyl transferase family 28 C-terminal domain-containing protein n=1 Tax=Panaeolus cyanescens TaxID=181874 RepID=A0A409VSH0_9AGAR|nr:hypothetical protein CVT24_000027 [Panaeolus cyanescens]
MDAPLSHKTHLCLVYYCSGHGYGHATRVSAFTRHLLSLEETRRPIVYIVSSAPRRIFADSISCGARYRNAAIDPVIVQPLAYRVDRRRSVDVLKDFLARKDELVAEEIAWLRHIGAHAVLSDAAFLGCLAAKQAGIPSALITNFTFDSVYSFLSTSISDVLSPDNQENGLSSLLDILPDHPIPEEELYPHIQQIHAGYHHADLLVRLPGQIPIPSFFQEPVLPAWTWIDVKTGVMRSDIARSILEPVDSQKVLPSIPFPPMMGPKIDRPRTVIQAPLLVRPPSSQLSVYTKEGRSHLLSSIGVPVNRHDPQTTKILVVSFGGQVFRCPSRPSSSIGSVNGSQERLSDLSPQSGTLEEVRTHKRSSEQPPLGPLNFNGDPKLSFSKGISPPTHFELHIPRRRSRSNDLPRRNGLGIELERTTHRLATPGHLWIPGAPPASKPILSPSEQSAEYNMPSFNTIPPTPKELSFENSLDLTARLLPDDSWIAIVCGASRDHLSSQEDSELPENFYVAPKDVYMPDLTAVADVLLGKLGYGTVSECVDACTPFVYVSRPLFIEEHGLRLLLDQDGVGVELSRQSYEAGDWAAAVNEALIRGADMKARKRYEMANGINVHRREEEGKALAGTVLDWVRRWWIEDARALAAA